MNEVAKHYNPLTLDLQRWDDIANQGDFKCMAIYGTLIMFAEKNMKKSDEKACEIDKKIDVKIGKIPDIERALTRYEEGLARAHYGEKKYFYSRLQSKKNEIEKINTSIIELEQKKMKLKPLRMNVAKAAKCVAANMPKGREVSAATIRQDFYHSKKLVEKADFEAHLKV